mmetsp:Transcript_19902/g.76326  ORF Transcript_19902/g.76326 Transcript_19902/m.76326 type:complete len:214 (+) Transcript_19902:2343-2984(+)
MKVASTWRCGVARYRSNASLPAACIPSHSSRDTAESRSTRRLSPSALQSSVWTTATRLQSMISSKGSAAEQSMTGTAPSRRASSSRYECVPSPAGAKANRERRMSWSNLSLSTPLSKARLRRIANASESMRADQRSHSGSETMGIDLIVPSQRGVPRVSQAPLTTTGSGSRWPGVPLAPAAVELPACCSSSKASATRARVTLTLAGCPTSSSP